MDFGSWNIDVKLGTAPQKVASAITELNEKIVGAEYELIAYLGSQTVNGINHAVLAEQIVVTGRDTKNVVVLIFNEKPQDMVATLVSIERVIESGGAFGGTNIDVKIDISGDVLDIWNEAFDGHVGCKVEPFTFLGTQPVNGTNYIFVAKVISFEYLGFNKVAIVTINDVEKRACVTDLLDNKYEASLRYAFTW